MKKNFVILLLSFSFIVLVFIIIFLSFIDNNKNDLLLANLNTETNLILFTGETCPHCKDVENYIFDNSLLDSLDISILEVYNNTKNAQFFEEKFNQCIYQPRVYGVPFLWHDKKCILGPIEIINYLNTLAD